MAIITEKFKINTANDFINDVQSTNSSIYAFMGRHIPWTDDLSPPEANQSLEAIELTTFDYLTFGKRVVPGDVSVMVARYNWSSNTVYAQYDPTDEELIEKNFFVITSGNNVYKCLYNNYGANSVVEPTITSANSIFRTSDGYIWKYMYNISSTNMNKFASNNYIPVTPNTDVQNAAIPGTIDVIHVAEGGQGWVTYHTGQLQGVVNNYSLVLQNTASVNNHFYTDSSIYLKDGMGASQIRTIFGYDGATKTVVTEKPIDLFVNIRVSDANGSFAEDQTIWQNTYAVTVSQIVPYMAVGNNFTQSDTGATGRIYSANSTDYIVIRTSPSVNFALRYPLVNDLATVTLKTGTATVNTTSNTVVGTATQFLTDYTINDYVQVGNQTRRIVSIANNTRMDVSWLFTNNFTTNTHSKVQGVATPTSITQLSANGTIRYVDLNGVQLSYDSPIGTFEFGELIRQPASFANGIVAFANSSVLRLNQVEGTFATNFPITGATSNATANVTVVTADPNITVVSEYRAFRLGLPVSTSSGNATVTGMYTIPNETTSYVVSPTVTIDGVNSINALAYSVVNTASNSIYRVIPINGGAGYTSANVTVSANALYGNQSSVDLVPLISPLTGHGKDPDAELGGNFVGISTTFGNTTTESHSLIGYGQYRTLGLIRNVAFDDLYLHVSTFDRVKMTISSVSNTFTTGEIIIQPSTNAAGILVVGNTTYLELKNVRGTFVANTADDDLYGLSSESTANTRVANLQQFAVNSNDQMIIGVNTAASATLVTSNSTILRITNAVGQFQIGEQVMDPSTNSYANVTGIYYANNTKTQTFSRFRQTLRVGLSANSGSFVNNELITQSTSSATAVVLSTTDDVDMILADLSGTFVNNEIISQVSTGANGRMIYANGTFMKLTECSGTFGNAAISGLTSGATANTTRKFVLVCTDINGTWSQETNNSITGTNSGAIGFSVFANTISFPDLVRNVGEVLYIENMEPITKTTVSQETMKIVIKF